MTSEANKISGQNMANLENIRKQRDVISNFINSDGAALVTGFIDANIPALTGGKKQMLELNLKQLIKKNF